MTVGGLYIWARNYMAVISTPHSVTVSGEVCLRFWVLFMNGDEAANTFSVDESLDVMQACGVDNVKNLKNIVCFIEEVSVDSNGIKVENSSANVLRSFYFTKPAPSWLQWMKHLFPRY